ncbi:MAG: zinc-dependent metalloprotease [Flavobacteriaceae bacterium]
MKKLTYLILLLVSMQPAFSQFFNNNSNVKSYKGYFNFYYDNSTDKLYLDIDKVGTEFLYVSALSQGVGSNDIGLDRGQLGGGRVVKFIKAGNKLLLMQPNQDYRAITDNVDEKNSVKEAFAKSVLFGFKIKETKNGHYLVDATDFFIRDAHGVTNRLKQTKQGQYHLDKSKSAFNIERTKAFPKNDEFDVLLTFSGNPKGNYIRSVVPTPSLVTVYQHHSFVQLPDDKYKPRAFDPRTASYNFSYLDYATPINKSIVKRFIFRHRLVKKYPNKAISEPVEPIIYYVDRGAPEPVRSALIEGASWWNQAFEAAGYKNAFQVKVLPKGVDPLDLRYNVIQWVHRSTRGWSYGASISDPRTGEILKGHVSLGSLRIRQDFLIASALKAQYKNGNNNDNEALQLALARIRQLAAHEVGHTLGFTHNFAASVNNRASVMDYPHPYVTIKNGQLDFSQAYDTGIGAWDKVAVTYAYASYAKNEKTKLLKGVLKAEQKGLKFLSDADARPISGTSPYAHLWDNGASATAELKRLLEVRKIAIQNFSIDNIKSGKPYSDLEDVFVPLYFLHRYQAEATVKLIGGLDYNYAVKGSLLTNKEVSPKDQHAALNGLMQSIDVNTLAIPVRIRKLFPPRAFGYRSGRESFKGKTGLVFDDLSAVATASEMTIAMLLNPQRAARLVQQKSKDAHQLGFSETLDVLINNTFKKNHSDSYQTELQNTVNYVVLKYMFNLAVNTNTYPQVNAIVFYKLNKLATYLKSQKVQGVQLMYNANIRAKIYRFMEEPSEFKLIKAPKIPDGSPIGG